MRRSLLVALVALAFSGAALADPLDPIVRLNKADQASATRALLVQGDLGTGWRGGTAAKPSSLKAPVCPSLRPDYSHLTITGHAESRFDNGNGGIQVVSDVEVWKTVKQAETHLNALLKPKLPTCLKYSLLKSGAGSKFILFPVEKKSFGQLADVTVRYREPIGYKIGGQTVPVINDFVFLREGRTEIYLNVVAPASAESQLTTFETRLARALVKRVRA